MEVKKLFLLVFIMFVGFDSVVYAFPLPKTDTITNKSLEYFKSIQTQTGGFGDAQSSYYSDITPFVVLILSSLNESLNDWNVNGKNPLDHIINTALPTINYDTPTTYLAVNMIALKQYNIDIENIIINGTPRNLTYELISRINMTTGAFNTSSWITDHMWGMLALISIEYNNTNYMNLTKEYLLNNTNPDGGWGCYGPLWCPNISSPDETAIGWIILYLIGYDNQTHIQKLREILKKQIDKDGGINNGWGSNIYSTSWVMYAINTIEGNYSEWYGAYKPIIINKPKKIERNNVEYLEESYDIEISLKNYLYEFLISMQNEDGSFKELFPYKPAQGTAYSVLALIGSSLLPNHTKKNIYAGENNDNIILKTKVKINNNNININTTINQTNIESYSLNLKEKIKYVEKYRSCTSTIIERKINIIDNTWCENKNTNIKIKSGEKIKIKIKGEEHEIKPIKYNKTHIILEIRSTPQQITIEYNKNKTIDIDKDGKDDIIINVKIDEKTKEFIIEIYEINENEVKELNKYEIDYEIKDINKTTNKIAEETNKTTNQKETNIEKNKTQIKNIKYTEVKAPNKKTYVVIIITLIIIIVLLIAILKRRNVF